MTELSETRWAEPRGDIITPYPAGARGLPTVTAQQGEGGGLLILICALLTY